MRIAVRLILIIISFQKLFAQPVFREDILKNGFEQTTIHQPNDYDGEVTVTLIKKTNPGNKKAVLYIHGFSDYFFQIEMANQYLSHGFDFYAIDLRKYGRSFLPNQRLFNVRNIHEYDADIDTALSIIHQSNYESVLLSGHSTGGLIISCYAKKNKGHERFNAVFLNSPFLDMNLSGFQENIRSPIGSGLGKLIPRKIISMAINPCYGYSISKYYYGEWDFDTLWKPIVAPPVNLGWARAIHRAHKQVQKGNCIDKPILIFQSHQSVYGNKWKQEYLNGDGVLDVNDIQKYGAKLGYQVKQVTIHNALHDVFLSQKESRDSAYFELFKWLEVVLP